MTRKIDEISKGESATIAGVVSDLKASGYNIKELLNENSKVIGIVLNNTKIKMDRNSEKILTYTMDYGKDAVRYFVEIDGKSYEILFNNEKITINTKDIDLGTIDKEPEVIVESNNNDLVLAELSKENKEKIILTSKNELGEVAITIREAKSGVTEVCTVKVMTLMTEIIFEPNIIDLERGKNIDLSSIIKITPEDTTEKIIYSSENESVATVSEEGVVIGISGGTTIITASNEDGSKKSTCTINVVIYAKGITLDKLNIEINKDDTQLLTVTLNPPDTTEPIVWNSEKTNVATITTDETGKNAIITAVGSGTSQITVTCGNEKAYCTVNVKVPTIRVGISPQGGKIDVGHTKQLTAIPTPSDTTDSVKWETSDASIATVSDSGLVTALKLGTVTITANCGNVKGTSTIEVIYTTKDITYSWEELVKVAGEISNNYPNIDSDTVFTQVNIDGNQYTLGVGDTKTIKINNKDIKIRILGFNHDLLVNQNSYGRNNTYAGISFECIDFLRYSVMTTAETADGGWGASKIRADLNGDTYSSTIEQLNIKQVIKEYGAERKATEVSQSNDYFWLLSCQEAYYSGNIANVNEGKRYKYYELYPCYWKATNTYNRKPSKFTGTQQGAEDWWLRSIPYNYGTKKSFCSVTSSGQFLYAELSYTLGVAPGFCI